ncbi:MAG: signal recognition particle receptor subunit alpha, partial [Euryarchaeota archaeon]
MFGKMKKLFSSVKERVTKRVERRAEEESPSPGKVKETETIEAEEKIEPKEAEEGKGTEEKVKEGKESDEKEERKEAERKRLKKPSLKEKLRRVIKREVTITEKDVKDILEEFELNLISNDVAVEVAESIREELERELIGKRVKGKSEIPKVVERSLQRALLSVLEPER